MQYRILGRTGPQVSTDVQVRTFSLGAMNLGAVNTIVPPGVGLAPEEKVDTPPSLLDPTLRRR